MSSGKHETLCMHACGDIIHFTFDFVLIIDLLPYVNQPAHNDGRGVFVSNKGDISLYPLRAHVFMWRTGLTFSHAFVIISNS